MPQTSTIHPTAVIEGDVHLDDDVIVGPHCIITGPVVMKSGTRLLGQNWIHGRAEIGHGNVLYPGARIGGPPQDLGFDHDAPDPGIVIGDENIFREGFTGHRGKTDQPTRIGNNNYFMTNTHVGHDAQVHNNCQLATGAVLGGHAVVNDKVIIGGNTAIHQFVHLGRGAFLTGGYATSQNVPPWFMMTATNTCGSLNLVGMRRSGMDKDEIARRKWVYKTLYRQGLSMTSALEKMRAEGDDPVIQEYIQFIESGDKPICHGATRPNRGGLA
ncbi:MAG: acyl-ACP--UDP-N-acetylglucosamine O-acyltransferase [Planctomycetota bacterium]|nr:acyl-ACP--UDP-N-acetylglucosamine O-acyltransferase [Planctomycetota bacterium]